VQPATQPFSSSPSDLSKDLSDAASADKSTGTSTRPSVPASTVESSLLESSSNETSTREAGDHAQAASSSGACVPTRDDVRVFRGVPPPGQRPPSALTIGNFDGVHLGHQAMLGALRDAAKRLSLVPTVMVFEPHPREYFARLQKRPELAPARIASLRDKLTSLDQAGVERVIVQRFDAALASMPPEVFIQQILVDGLNVRWLLVGDDFRFGARRAGNIDTLREAGARLGFEVVSLPTVSAEGQRISSSAIRAALANGDFAQAKKLLGHPYMMGGHVIHGRKLGRTIGYPTMNLGVASGQTSLTGIFVVQVHGLAPQPLQGVASLGVRPTVEDAGRVLLETYIFDFSGDAYGKLVRVEFLKKLRDEAKFVDLPTLIAAIDRDVDHARAWFDTTHRVQSDLASSAIDRI